MIDEYTVLDLETTGLSKFYHRITEIGAVRVQNGEIVDEYQTLVNPGVHIPSFITRLTGISDDMVKDKDPIDKTLPNLTRFLKADVVVAHNASFDRGFLEFNYEKHLRQDFRNEFLCTKKLATRLLPELTSRKLSAITEHLSIKNDSAHRALSDVIATKHVFEKFNYMLHERGIRTKEEAIKFQSIPKSRISVCKPDWK